MSRQRETDVTQREAAPVLDVTPEPVREPSRVARALAALVRAYQLILSPRLASSCRFEPSCSAYAHEALLMHGAGRGGWLAVRRLLRCHPFSTAGYDPVPPLLLDRGPGPDGVGDNVVARSGPDLPLVPAVPGRHDLPTEE